MLESLFGIPGPGNSFEFSMNGKNHGKAVRFQQYTSLTPRDEREHTGTLELVPGSSQKDLASIVRKSDIRASNVFTSGRSGPPKFIFETARSQRKCSGLVQFLIKLLEYWKIDESKAVIMLGFAVDESELVKQILKGNEMLPERQDVVDRISHLLSIRHSLYGFFQDNEVENEWLREPQPLLDEEILMNLLLSGKYEDILLVREYVDTVTGMNFA